MDTARKLILVLSVFLASCLSAPHKIAEIPSVQWPRPPDPDGRVFLLREACEVPAGAIVMTPDFWQELVTYIVEMEQLRMQELQVARKVYR